MKMLVYIQMTPLLGSPHSARPGNCCYVWGRFSPQAQSISAGSDKAACASDVPRGTGFRISETDTLGYLARPVTFQRGTEKLTNGEKQACFGIKGQWRCLSWVLKVLLRTSRGKNGETQTLISGFTVPP